MPPTVPFQPGTKRELILHDGVAFLALLATSIVLFAVTLFLFGSFQSHRADLAVRWSARGKQALEQGQPDAAVAALRTALSYAPDERADQLLLAQALARAGHTDEATNYFLNLWDTRPGDGFINLQLARLSRTRHDDRAATDYYRAAIFGSWEGDGVLRRREVRLELTDFLIEQRQNAEARNELFTIAGNAPANYDLNMTVAAKLEAAGYLPDALSFYLKASALSPRDRRPLERAGGVAYALGDYPRAARLLDRAQELKPAPGDGPAQQQELASLVDQAHRIQQLSLSRDQPARERAQHILSAATIAQTRLSDCLARPDTSANNALALTGLNNRWTAATAPRNARRILLDNASAQDTWTELVFETERMAAQACGAPTGDDALLLRLADAAGKDQNADGK